MSEDKELFGQTKEEKIRKALIEILHHELLYGTADSPNPDAYIRKHTP